MQIKKVLLQIEAEIRSRRTKLISIRSQKNGGLLPEAIWRKLQKVTKKYTWEQSANGKITEVIHGELEKYRC